MNDERTQVSPELDPATLAQAQGGSSAACRRLVEHYQGPVFALLSRMLPRRRHIVEDLAQETFLRVFRALPGFSPAGPARLSTWILTIATRLALDELARRTPECESLAHAELLAAPGRADEVAERRALLAAVEQAMLRLTPEQRAVVLLREIHGLEYDEIARALEIDLGTVKSRLSRARASLREQLEDVRDA